MRNLLRICLLAVALAALQLTVPAWAFIQERLSDALPVRWNLATPQPNVSGGKVVYLINSRGSDDVPFAALTAAVESAFGAWRVANGSVIDFMRVADPSTGTNGTTPNRKDRTNVVYWDEDPRKTAFMLPTMTAAGAFRDLNPSTGEILDADVVLNASQFLWIAGSDGNFTTLTGPVDIQQALTSSIGGFIGLNIVPTAGSVMSAFDYPGSTSRYLLTSDERAAVLDIYPPSPNPPVTSISGQVTRSGNPVFGAYVVAFQNGLPVVGAIANHSGNYSIRRLPNSTPTSYVVRVVTTGPPPGSPFYAAPDNNFLSEVYLDSSMDPPSTPVTATPGTDTPGINIAVAAANTLDPWESDDSPGSAKLINVGVRQIHHSYPQGDVDYVKFNPIVGHVYAIDTGNLGSGVSESNTILILTGEAGCPPPCSNSDRDEKQISKTSRIVFLATSSTDHFVQAAQEAGAFGSGTAYDILVTDLGASPLPTPGVSAVTPPGGSQGGGYQVSISGMSFVAGAGVSFGATPGTQVDVVSPTKLFVTVPVSCIARCGERDGHQLGRRHIDSPGWGIHLP